MSTTENAPGAWSGKASCSPSLWMTALASGVIVLAAIVTYHNSFAVPFIFDDVASIPQNRSIRQLGSIGTVLSPPQQGRSVGGRPLVNLSLAVNYAFGGTRLWGYHATNLAIHVMAGLTLFGIVRRTMLQPMLAARFAPASLPLALAAAVLWTVHPLQTESVTYVVQRAESLMGLLYLLTLYCVIRGTEPSGSGTWLISSAVACLLGMATKEVMVTAPLMVWLYDATFVAGSFQKAWQQRWRLYLGLACAWLVVGYLAVGTSGRGGTAGLSTKILWWEYALTQCWALGRYLRLAVWPYGLVFDYGTGLVTDPAQIVPGAVIVAALLAATAIGLRYRPGLGFLGAWFFVILAPSSSVIPVASQTIAEHRMYLPLAAVVVLAAVGIYALMGRRSWVVLFGMAVGLGFLTVSRNNDYCTEWAIYTDTVAKRPGNARGHWLLGNVLLGYGQVSDAIAQYEEGLRLKPDDAEAHSNLGAAYQRMNKTTQAIEQLEEALRIKPDSADVRYNLGNLRLELGDLNGAIAQYEEAIRLDPGNAAAELNLGIAHYQAGRTSEAIRHWEEALRIDSGMAEAWYNLGIALERSDKPEDAIRHFEQALLIRPGYPEARSHLAHLQAVRHPRQDPR